MGKGASFGVRMKTELAEHSGCRVPQFQSELEFWWSGLLDNLGISCCQRVLGRKVPMRPGGRIISRMDGSQLRDQALPQDCRLLRRERWLNIASDAKWLLPLLIPYFHLRSTIMMRNV